MRVIEKALRFPFVLRARDRALRASRSHELAVAAIFREEAPFLDSWSRSREDLETKVQRGDASTSDPRRLEWHLEFEDGLNAEEDHSIIPIGRAVRAVAAGPGRLR